MDALAGDIEIQLPPDDDDDPHVRVVGSLEGVQMASSLVREDLEPLNRVTMKMDVPWIHHSHIIGRSGCTIQPVVKKTGASIHFPDGNKSNDVKKSNQVSINSRGEDLGGLEEARQAIRRLTPLIFTFTLSSSVQFVSVVDANMLILQVQNTYNVQVELRVTEKMVLVGCVRGCESELQRVKEATHCILKAYCSTLANQVPIQMSVEISPQHHAFVVGRYNERIKRIMHRTATNISFGDWNDPSLSPLKKSTVTISGALENVYLARQNIIGSLPLVLMFDLAPGSQTEAADVAQMMQVLDVQIALRTCRLDGRRPVVVKGAERNAENVYEAWRMLCKIETPSPKAHIPPSYHIPDPQNFLLHPNFSDVGYGGQWVGGGSGGSSPIPSPTSTPTPHHHHSSTSLWGGLSSSNTSTTSASTSLFPLMSRPILHDPTSSSTSGTMVRNCIYNHNNNNHHHHNNNHSGRNDNHCILPLDTRGCGGGGGGVNLDALMKSMRGVEVTNGDYNPGTSSNSGSSSLSSPAHSPRNASPDQALGSSINSNGSHFPDTPDAANTSAGIHTLTALLKDVDRRAPGCEKKHMERVAATVHFSDYTSKKMEAAKAMKQDVGSTPRTPTSSWSGYGFSKSMPGFMIRQKLQEAKEARQNGIAGGVGVGGVVGGIEEWSEETWRQQQQQQEGVATNGLTAYPTSPAASTSVSTSQTHRNMKYLKLAQFATDKSLSTLPTLPPPPRPPVNLSVSNFMDCMLPRTRDRDALNTRPSLPSSSPSQGQDITSILSDLQLTQYIDVFMSHEVDLKMFMSLEDYELKELGISIFGHRKRILMAIKDASSKDSLFTSGATGGVDRPSILRDSTKASPVWN